MPIRFAAFLMTYKRTDVLPNTILQLFKQSHPPEMVLLIDNDPDQSAKNVFHSLPHLPLEYYATGYNAGPAGAAKLGLELLTKKGFDWIGWIDDDDPPLFQNTFEILLKLANENHQCGSVGTVGQRFNHKNGLMDRVMDSELQENGSLEVDNIAGNMCKIVNADVVRKNNILPDEQLFFGFEELDFDLRLKKEGYVLLVDRELYKKHRNYYNRSNFNVKRGVKKSDHRLWREYYSTRNELFILQKNNHYRAVLICILRFLLKAFLGFRFGIKYGRKNAVFIITGLLHFFKGKKGQLNQ